MTQKVILVTGSNKGIGFGIIETLLEKKSKLVIILSARNEELGKKSMNYYLQNTQIQKINFIFIN